MASFELLTMAGITVPGRSQLKWRESLRDIEVCLAFNHAKLFQMGLKSVIDSSTHRRFRQHHNPYAHDAEPPVSFSNAPSRALSPRSSAF
jgi:hypothetical protein